MNKTAKDLNAIKRKRHQRANLNRLKSRSNSGPVYGDAGTQMIRAPRRGGVLYSAFGTRGGVIGATGFLLARKIQAALNPRSRMHDMISVERYCKFFDGDGQLTHVVDRVQHTRINKGTAAWDKLPEPIRTTGDIDLSKYNKK